MEEKIKCCLCGGKAELKHENFELENGRITINDSPYYKCSKCKEEFSTSEQMQDLSDLINNKFVFQRSIINAGRSLAITIPSDLAQYYNLKKGEKIKIIPEGKKEIKLLL